MRPPAAATPDAIANHGPDSAGWYHGALCGVPAGFPAGNLGAGESCVAANDNPDRPFGRREMGEERRLAERSLVAGSGARSGVFPSRSCWT